MSHEDGLPDTTDELHRSMRKSLEWLTTVSSARLDLSKFSSQRVSVALPGWGLKTDLRQMIPADIKYDGHATPPQWTDGADQTIEKGTQIRLKIKGMRTDMGSLYAIGTIKEDYLGVTEVSG